jgi:hypothetical protein
MKKLNGSDRTLESFKIFPYVAWGLTALFAFFVYDITQELRDVTEQLQTQADQIQLQVDNLQP